MKSLFQYAGINDWNKPLTYDNDVNSGLLNPTSLITCLLYGIYCIFANCFSDKKNQNCIEFPQHSGNISNEHLQALGPYIRCYCIASRSSLGPETCQSFHTYKREFDNVFAMRYALPFMLFNGESSSMTARKNINTFRKLYCWDQFIFEGT